MGVYKDHIKDALPSIKKVRDLKKKLESKGVKYIYSNWIDFLGSPKTKPMPISDFEDLCMGCLLYTSPSPRDVEESRMPSSA